MEYSLIFGACGGIGKAFTKALALKGKNLILVGTSISKLSKLKEEIFILNNTINVEIFTCNLVNQEDRENLYFSLKNLVISELYYVAGIDTRMDFLKYTENKIVMQARVNFEGAVSSINFLLKQRKTPLKILVVSSLCGFTPMPYFSEYSATKSALNFFCFALRKELSKTGVKLTVLAPSSVPTREDIVKDIKLQGLSGKLAQKSPEYVVKKGLKALEKNKRLCIPGTYNKLVYFLNKITPYAIKTTIIKRKFKGKEKDAFL